MHEQARISPGKIEQGSPEEAIKKGARTSKALTGKGSHAKMAAQKLRDSYTAPKPVKGACWVPLSRGLFALVDEEDFDRVNRKFWTAVVGKAVTYAMFRDQSTKQSVFLHQWILGAPEGFVLDHRNSNGLDCRKANLRVCSPENNRRHNRKWRTPTSSKFKGVCLDKKHGKWTAQITSGKKIHLGRFDTEIEAAKAYNEAAKERFGEFAILNCPDN